MQRMRSSSNSYNAGKNATCQDLIYQHMSSHYRRILNAKKVVDTSPPYCYKQKRSNSAKIVPSLGTSKSSKERSLFLGRNGSPIQTDRSVSTNSYKESNSYTAQYGSSRYHARCLEDVHNPDNKKWALDKSLVDRIAFDTKNGPSMYCDGRIDAKYEYNHTALRGSTVRGKQNNSGLSDPRNSKRPIQTRRNESKQKRKYSDQEKPPPTDISVKHIQFFSSSNSDFKPRILKTKAVSKLRSMRVYYPPRRKKKGLQSKSSSELAINCPLQSSNCKCSKVCVCDGLNLKKSQTPKEQSQTSSRDSAYNGGVSSIADSRSPTPDQKEKKSLYLIPTEERIFFEKRNQKLDKPKKGAKNATEPESSASSRNETPREPKSKMSICPTTPKSKILDDDGLKQMKEDALYIKFVQDITVEILDKCLYTNKALKKIMKKHIINNIGTLDKNRMCKEVENLRIQLGIPEDESLFQLDAEVTESSCEIPQVYSMISDSEFTLPTEDANLTTEKELTSNIENKTSKNLKKNTSPDSEVSKLKNNKNKKFCCNFNAGRICKKKLGLLELLKKEDNFSSKAPVTLFENGQNCLDKSETSFGSIRNLKEEEDPIETSSYSSLELVEKIAAKISEDFTERNEVTENTPIDIKTAPEMLPCIIDDSSPSRIRKLRCVSFWNQHKSFLEESKSPCGDK